MVEIIKKGTKIIRTCQKCGCEFSFDEIEDVIRIPNTLHAGLTCRIVPCPQCNAQVFVDKENVK